MKAIRFFTKLATLLPSIAFVTCGTAFAQQAITYTDGENNSSAIVITSATNPTTLELSSGSAMQSGAISDSGTTGSVDVNAGSGTITLTAYNTYTGGTTIDFGTLAVSGAGAAIDPSSNSYSTYLYVGNDSRDNGSLLISNGGEVVTDEPSYAVMGYSYGSIGTATVTGVNSNGASSLLFGANLYVGLGGNGTLNVQDGGEVFSAGASIGNNSGSNGTATVTGVNANGTASSLSDNYLTVGNAGTGSLTISNGGQVTAESAFLGGDPGSNGAVTVTGINTNGTASTWSVTTPVLGNPSALYIGNFGVGTVTVANGGVVNTPSVTMANSGSAQGTLNLNSNGVLETGSITDGTGIGGASINFNGGILRATASSSNFVDGFSSGGVTLLSGGGTIDNNGYNISISSPIGGTGGLTAIGAGTTTLTAANTYTGNTTVESGILAVSGAGAAIDSPNANVFTGYNSGDRGELLISNGGQVTNNSGTLGNAANSVGTVTVTGVNANGTASTWNNSVNLAVGELGSGILNIEDGGFVSTNGGYIADGVESTGIATVTGVNANGKASTWENTSLAVGGNATGTLNVENGGQVTDLYGYIGFEGNAIGTATVTGINGSTSSLWNNSYALYVGYQGPGTGKLTVEDGGVVEVEGGSGVLTLAYASNSAGTLNIGDGNAAGTIEAADVTGGSGTAQVNFGETDSSYIFAPSLTGSLSVTQNGSGTTTLTGNNTYAGSTTVDFGTLAVSGAAATINSPNSLVYVGSASGDNGAFVISNGAHVTDAYGELGSSANSTGTVTVTGMNSSTASTWTNSAYIDVGVYGAGTLNIEDGAQVSAYGTYISDEASANGTVMVTGVGANGTPSTLRNSQFTFVGEAGSGTLNIENGGYVADQIAEVGSVGQGTVTVTGINAGLASTWNNSNDLYIGFYNQGTLNVENGGVVEVDGGVGAITLAYEPGGTGTLNIGDGTSAGTIEAAQVTGVAGTSEVEFDETDKSYTFAPSLTGNLKVVQAGTGMTILTGANTYTGGTTVSGGSLVASGSGALGSGTVTVSGGALSSSSSSGTAVGGKLSLSSGTIALTSSAVPTFQLALNQDFEMTGGTLSLTFSLGTVGSISSLGGDFTLNGGTLNLNDSFASPADYALTYDVLTGFSSGSVSNLSIIGYDTADYSAHLSNGGDLTFTPEAAPEPASWALLLLGVFAYSAAFSRRSQTSESSL